MTTEVKICNSALLKLGAERINSLTESNKRAILCNEQYAKIRDLLLMSHPWWFAKKRTSLALTGNTPAYEYTTEFALPADFLKLHKVENAEDEYLQYQIEGDLLLSNVSTMNITYIARITDATKFPPSFAELLALRLAHEISYSLIQSVTLKDSLYREMQVLLRDVRSINAQGKGRPDDLGADEWLSIRL
jgi:hypothetical protein